MPRSAGVYGRGKLTGELEELRVVADQFGAPTWARLAAEVLALALQLDLARRRNGGFDSCTFHMTAAGETSRHGFSSAIVSAARERGAALKCRSVASIATAEYPLPATWPANSRLSRVKRAGRCRLETPGWDRCMHL